MEKLWQTGGGSLHPDIEAYTVGNDPQFDTQLLPFDIRASKAHAMGLQRISLLSAAECDAILKELEQMDGECKSGNLVVTQHDEDCHTLIEKRLTQQLGDTGKKIHTGRSRNDQVLVAVRLYMKDALLKIRRAGTDFAETLLSAAETYKAVPLPGYSHTQQAMLSSVGHYYAAILESMIDDMEFAAATLKHIDANPLGSAAGFGVSFPLDRKFTGEALGFQRTQMNSLYCQNSRGKFESAFMEACAQIMMTLAKFAQDALVFTSQEFSFFEVDQSLTTGSSIMPQKKNLDGLEILRGNAAVVTANHSMIHTLAKGTMSGYNRDFQLMKKPLMESAAIVEKSIGIARLYVLGMRPREDRIRLAITPDIFRADVANALVAKEGKPFRDAYAIAKEGSAPEAVDLQKSIDAKISPGGPGNLQLELSRCRLEQLRQA